MCLDIIKQKSLKVKQDWINWINDEQKHITQQDIVVYKVFKIKFNTKGASLETAHRQYKCELGTHYYQIPYKNRENSKLDISGKFRFRYYWGGISIYQGLHSWSTFNRAKKLYIEMEGFGSSSQRIIVKAIIPKGSIVFHGNDKDLCSDNLIIPETTNVYYKHKGKWCENEVDINSIKTLFKSFRPK